MKPVPEVKTSGPRCRQRRGARGVLVDIEDQVVGRGVATLKSRIEALELAQEVDRWSRRIEKVHGPRRSVRPRCRWREAADGVLEGRPAGRNAERADLERTYPLPS